MKEDRLKDIKAMWQTLIDEYMKELSTLDTYKVLNMLTENFNLIYHNMTVIRDKYADYGSYQRSLKNV